VIFHQRAGAEVDGENLRGHPQPLEDARLAMITGK
jgi:hypothetical protein